MNTIHKDQELTPRKKPRNNWGWSAAPPLLPIPAPRRPLERKPESRARRHGEVWSESELARLKEMTDLGMTAKAMARTLGRHTQAVQQKKSLQQLVSRPTHCFCGTPVEQPAAGRPRMYCSASCRQDMRTAYARNDRMEEV